jgi:hypothetical protein
VVQLLALTEELIFNYYDLSGVAKQVQRRERNNSKRKGEIALMDSHCRIRSCLGFKR